MHTQELQLRGRQEDVTEIQKLPNDEWMYKKPK